MFEQLFRHAGTVEQYRTAPLADCRLRYLTHWLKLGAARSTLRKIAGNQVEVVRLLDRPDSPACHRRSAGYRQQPLAALGVVSRHRGPHALRHACAQRLLDQGLSLKEIGDHLGHRSPTATAVYAKIDLAGLRQVADFDLEGLA